ncbi:MAG TPA: aldo/keto reductase, partial [Chthonomonadales bacterium]|nr:aldo/keto reductase [Chthonomonadales bacterium]
MLYGRLEGIDAPVSRLVLGTIVCQLDSLQLTRDLLDEWLEQGGNCIDTANVYGTSESAIGAWMAERAVRDRVILLTKGGHPRADRPHVNREAVFEDIEESLRRLQTSKLDIYLLHRDDPATPVGEFIECLNEQRAAGRINLFGASNWTTERIDQANEYAAAHGLTGFSLNSPYFGLAIQNEPMWRGCHALSDDERRWHRDRQFPLFPWSA